MNISRVGVDLAKNIFQLHGADSKGHTVWKRGLSRDKWLQPLVMVNNTAKAETWPLLLA